jgi:hypothetical protein
MKIGSIVRTGTGMYGYERILAIVISRQAPRAVSLRVIEDKPAPYYSDTQTLYGDVIHAIGFDYEDLEVISESR